MSSKYFSDEELELIKKQGISLSRAINRANSGWTIKEILGEVKRDTRSPKGECKHFTQSELEILKKKNIDLKKAINRLTLQGWTKEEAMELKPRKQKPIPSKYFTEFERKALKKKGISLNCAIKRRKKGLDIAEILSPTKRGMKREWDKDVFALYKGEDLITTGTIYEIAKEKAVKVDSIKKYVYPFFHQRDKGNAQILVYIGKDDEEEVI